MTNKEINEAVARKLGWAQCDGNGLPGWHRSERAVKECGGNNIFHEGLPNYTHSIAAAWEVVEKMGSVGIFKTEEGHWCVAPDFGLSENSQDEWYFKGEDVADTAPMAICLEFLRLP